MARDRSVGHLVLQRPSWCQSVSMQVAIGAAFWLRSRGKCGEAITRAPGLILPKGASKAIWPGATKDERKMEACRHGIFLATEARVDVHEEKVLQAYK